jgi:hypothetical protein
MKKVIRFKRHLAFFCISGLLAFSACNKEEVPQYTVGVQVINLNNQFLSGVEVKLYPSLIDFNNNSNVAITMTTNDDGLAATEQPLTGGNYFIWADKNDEDNWNGDFDSVFVAFSNNIYQVITVQIGNTFSSALANTMWDLSDVIIDGVSVWDSLDVCYKDNYLEIKRDYIIKELEGDDVCPGSSPIISSGNIDPGYVGQPGALGYLIPDNFFDGTIYLSDDFSEIKVVIEENNIETVKVFLPG